MTGTHTHVSFNISQTTPILLVTPWVCAYVCMCKGEHYLHGGYVGMAHISMNILDLRQVLLCHLDQFSSSCLLCELGGALVLGGRVIIMVSVLLKHKEESERREMIP